MEIVNIPETKKKKYQDEWLLFEVTETDKLNRPFKGMLIAHSPSRIALDEYWDNVTVKNPYITYAGIRPRKGIVSVI